MAQARRHGQLDRVTGRPRSWHSHPAFEHGAGSTITPSVAVSVEDAGGNVVGLAHDSITVAIGTNPGSSTLSGTTTVNAVNGVATFSTLSLNKVGTGYT